MSKNRRFAFTFVTLLVLFLCFEGAARVFGVCACHAPVPSTGSWQEMQADKRYLWRLTPNYVIRGPDGGSTTINALGLRDSFLPREKAKNERRILTTGDSSVYGWGVPEGRTYQEVLESGLNRTFPQYRFEVINLGVPGYSSVQSLRLLDDVGWSYQPDMLMVSNIFSDCNIDTFQDEKALAMVNVDDSPLHHSRTYCAMWNLYAQWYSTSNQERNRVLMPGVPRDTTILEKVDQVVDLSRVPLTRYLENLETMRTVASAHGAGMMLVPLAQEWDVGQWSVPSLARPVPGQVLPWHPYRKAMAQYASTHSLPLVSMPDAFGQAKASGRRLFNDPVHPSPDGAAVMAEALLQYFSAHPESLQVTR